MKLTKCSQGHFFDADKYEACPHCQGGGAQAGGASAGGSMAHTVPITPPGGAQASVAPAGGSMDHTVPLTPGGNQSAGQQAGVTPAGVTIDTKPATPPTEPATKKKDLSGAVDDVQKTVGIFNAKPGKKEPVAGWLVCVDGPHYGEDFRIRMGRNFVGRGSNMDIVLANDNSVSRDKHSIIVYEPKGNMFIVQAGDSKELSYINDRVILSPVELNPYDTLKIGASTLLFVPFCSENFTWQKDED